MRNMGTDLFIKAHAVYSYAKVSALTRIASALLLSITIFLGWIDVYIRSVSYTHLRAHET